MGLLDAQALLDGPAVLLQRGLHLALAAVRAVSTFLLRYRSI